MGKPAPAPPPRLPKLWRWVRDFLKPLAPLIGGVQRLPVAGIDPVPAEPTLCFASTDSCGRRVAEPRRTRTAPPFCDVSGATNVHHPTHLRYFGCRPHAGDARDRGAGVVSLARDESDAAAVIAKFKEKDPGLTKVFAESAGYVVFPTVAKGGLGIGGARGKGYVYQHGRLIGRSTLTQLTIGLQAGGQAYSEVIFFKDDAALENFKRGHLKLDAQASAVALTERVSADLAYREGSPSSPWRRAGSCTKRRSAGRSFPSTRSTRGREGPQLRTDPGGTNNIGGKIRGTASPRRLRVQGVTTMDAPTAALGEPSARRCAAGRALSNGLAARCRPRERLRPVDPDDVGRKRHDVADAVDAPPGRTPRPNDRMRTRLPVKTGTTRNAESARGVSSGPVSGPANAQSHQRGGAESAGVTGHPPPSAR